MGTVVVGEGRGKNLGFPTANLDLQGEAHPPQGVYRTQTVAVGKQWDSVTNIGRRPTFTPKERDHTGSVVVETHLLHFKGDLLGEDVEVIFLEKVRNEVRCRSEEQLMKLIAADVEYARSRAAQ
jgi:riboflavin kinase/FMN adenylyltransferase